MLRTRWFLMAACAMSIGVLALHLRAQTEKQEKPVSPEQFFSADTVAYFRLDGSKTHQAEWEKTAAYKALVKSGLAKSLDNWLAALAKQEPRAEIGRKLLWHVLENGISMGVAPPLLSQPADDPRSGEMEVTIVLHNGAKLLPDVDALIPGERQLLETDITGTSVAFRRIALPDLENLFLCTYAQGDHLAICVGPEAPLQTWRTLHKKNPDITTLPDWKRRNTLDDGQLLTGVAWVDTRRIIETYRDYEIPDSPPGQVIKVGDILELLGIDNLTEILGRQGFEGAVCVSRVDILHDGPRRGLLQFADSTPITLKDLPPLPEYGAAFMSTSLDFAGLYQTGLETIFAFMDCLQAPDNARAEFEHQLEEMEELIVGVNGDLKDTLLANLGPVCVLFSDPTNGIGGFGAGLAVQAREPDTLREVLNNVLRLVPDQQNPNGLLIVRIDKEGQEYVSFIAPGVPIEPTLTITDDWLVVGLSPQTVDSFVQRLKGELDPWKPSAEQQALLDKLPAEFTSLSLTDPRETIRTINQYLPLLQGAVASSPEGARFPLPELPSAERIVKSMFPSAHVTTVDDSGIHVQSRQALPGLPLLGSPDGVSVGTAAIGVALLLPAVQQAREAARRTQSKNNLKQIGLSLHNYHDVHNEFPAGIIEGQDTPEESISWLALMLPYIDQPQLFNQLEMTKPWNDEVNKAIGQNEVMFFRNPSATDVFLNGYGRSDYAGVAGIGEDGPRLAADQEGAGIFAYDRVTKIRDITDGTSNTLMVGDVGGDRGPWLQGGKGTIRPFVKQPYIGGPDGWGGIHVGGGQFLFADGSVRFISRNIDPKTMEALITIQGGEPLGDF